MTKSPIEMIGALENVCDYDDIDCVEAVSYRQGALQALVEVVKAGGTVPADVLTHWLEVSQQAVDTYQDVPRWDEIEENTNA